MRLCIFIILVYQKPSLMTPGYHCQSPNKFLFTLIVVTGKNLMLIFMSQCSPIFGCLKFPVEKNQRKHQVDTVKTE